MTWSQTFDFCFEMQKNPELRKRVAEVLKEYD